MRLKLSGSSCVVMGIAMTFDARTAVPGAMLIAGGLAWAVMQSYWEVQKRDRELDDMERIDNLTRQR